MSHVGKSGLWLHCSLSLALLAGLPAPSQAQSPSTASQQTAAPTHPPASADNSGTGQAATNKPAPEKKGTDTPRLDPSNSPEPPSDKPLTESQRKEADQIAQRQKELADDTARLLTLANELKAEMDKSTKDTLSMNVVKKADEVEKLAHKVRNEMKKSMGN